MERKKLTGVVQKNIGRGVRLGFPTANVETDVAGVEDGIYTALTGVLGQKYKSLAFVGAAETFGDKKKKLEVYILDFHQEIYGREITVQLLEKIRDNMKFETEADLVEQMKQDEKQARTFFTTYGRIE